MGYFEDSNGTLIGDRQADIIGDELKSYGIANEELFKKVVGDESVCTKLYSRVKKDFVKGEKGFRDMSEKEFDAHLKFVCGIKL